MYSQEGGSSGDSCPSPHLSGARRERDSDVLGSGISPRPLNRPRGEQPVDMEKRLLEVRLDLLRTGLQVELGLTGKVENITGKAYTEEEADGDKYAVLLASVSNVADLVDMTTQMPNWAGEKGVCLVAVLHDPSSTSLEAVINLSNAFAAYEPVDGFCISRELPALVLDAFALPHLDVPSSSPGRCYTLLFPYGPKDQRCSIVYVCLMRVQEEEDVPDDAHDVVENFVQAQVDLPPTGNREHDEIIKDLIGAVDHFRDACRFQPEAAIVQMVDTIEKAMVNSRAGAPAVPELLLASGACQSRKSPLATSMALVASRHRLGVVVVSEGNPQRNDMCTKLNEMFEPVRRNTGFFNALVCREICNTVISVTVDGVTSNRIQRTTVNDVATCLLSNGVVVMADLQGQWTKLQSAIETAKAMNPEFRWVLIQDEADSADRSRSGDRTKAEQNFKKLMASHPPLVHMSITATLLSVLLRMVERMHDVDPKRIIVTEPAAAYVSADEYVPMRDPASNAEVFLLTEGRSSELKKQSNYINEKVHQLLDQLVDASAPDRIGKGLLLDYTCNQVTAAGGMFDKAVELQERYPGVIMVVSSGFHLCIRFGDVNNTGELYQHDAMYTPTGSSRPLFQCSPAGPDVFKGRGGVQFTGWTRVTVPNLARRHRKTGDVIDFIDSLPFGRNRQVAIFANMTQGRGLSMRGRDRVPTHMVFTTTDGISIEKMIQAFSRPCGENRQQLIDSGYGHVTVLVRKADRDLATAYRKLQVDILKRHSTYASLDLCLSHFMTYSKELGILNATSGKARKPRLIGRNDLRLTVNFKDGPSDFDKLEARIKPWTEALDDVAKGRWFSLAEEVRAKEMEIEDDNTVQLSRDSIFKGVTLLADVTQFEDEMIALARDPAYKWIGLAEEAAPAAGLQIGISFVDGYVAEGEGGIHEAAVTKLMGSVLWALLRPKPALAAVDLTVDDAMDKDINEEEG